MLLGPAVIIMHFHALSDTNTIIFTWIMKTNSLKILKIEHRVPPLTVF